jgi:hypothetical protein
MYYDERLRSPISEYNVKRMYGINPTNEPSRAILAGIYPLQEVPAGFSASRYEKVGNTYRAIPQYISNADKNNISKIEKIGTFMRGMLAAAATDVTVAVTVSAGKFLFDGQAELVVDKYAGTIILDQSDSSNTNHPIALSEIEDGTHNGGEEYTNNVTYTGTPGTDGKLTFVLDIEDTNSVTLYPYCENHSGMGSADGITYGSVVRFTYVNI